MFVLNFHGIGAPQRELDAGEQDVWLERGRFVEILDAVRDREDVRLTFDDGNRSDVAEALPELAQRGMRARFFVCPGRFGDLAFVDASQVRELRGAGMEIGSHGMDHIRWRRLSPAATQREIVDAKTALEEVLEEPVVAAACPFGAYDRRSLGALREAGYSRVYTSDGGPASDGDWLVARRTVQRDDTPDSVARMLDGSHGTASATHKFKRWVKHWR